MVRRLPLAPGVKPAVKEPEKKPVSGLNSAEAYMNQFMTDSNMRNALLNSLPGRNIYRVC